jgi:hypothetical protein
VSIGYTRQPLDDHRRAALAQRAKGHDIDELVPSSLDGLRTLIEGYLAAGASKFVVRPIDRPADWRQELEEVAAAVGDLQT